MTAGCHWGLNGHLQCWVEVRIDGQWEDITYLLGHLLLHLTSVEQGSVQVCWHLIGWQGKCNFWRCQRLLGRLGQLLHHILVNIQGTSCWLDLDFILQLPERWVHPELQASIYPQIARKILNIWSYNWRTEEDEEAGGCRGWHTPWSERVFWKVE